MLQLTIRKNSSKCNPPFSVIILTLNAPTHVTFICHLSCVTLSTEGVVKRILSSLGTLSILACFRLRGFLLSPPQDRATVLLKNFAPLTACKISTNYTTSQESKKKQRCYLNCVSDTESSSRK